MESPIINQMHSQSDEEAKMLFDQIDPEQSSVNPFENVALHEESPSKGIKKLKKTTTEKKKTKKQRKKQKKLKKLKAKLLRANKSNQDQLQEGAPQFQNAKKKMHLLDSDEDSQPNHKGSDPSENQSVVSEEFSSESENFENLNPDNSQSEGDESKTPKKRRLLSSNKKEKLAESRRKRIMREEGFDIKELGNDASANIELEGSIDSSDNSYSEDERGKKRRQRNGKAKGKKQKKEKITNEQLLEELRHLGCEDQQLNQDSAQRNNYDSGIDQLHKMKSKKSSKSTIKVQNKLFGNLESELEKAIQEQEAQETQEDLELNFNARKTSVRSLSSSFLSKAETMKKHRGLEADIDELQFQKISKEKARKSMAELVNRITDDVQDNDEIDIEVKAPAITKGKNSTLINNTIFIRTLSQKAPEAKKADDQELKKSSLPNGGSAQTQSIEIKKTTEVDIPAQQTVGAQQSQSRPQVKASGKARKSVKGLNRSDLFRCIRETIQKKQSKQVSEDELRNSFKQSRLEELEELRRKLEEKRKNEIKREFGEFDDDEDAEDVIDGLEKELVAKGGMSRAELRMLMRKEEGLEELEAYEEVKENQKSKSAQGDVVDEQPEKGQQKQSEQQESSLDKSLRQKLSKGQIQEEPLEARHKDDMVEQMEAEAPELKSRVSQLIEMEEDSVESESQEGEDPQSQGSSEAEGQSQSIVVQDEEEKSKRRKVERQLQDEGIVLPGNKYASKPSVIQNENSPITQTEPKLLNIEVGLKLINKQNLSLQSNLRVETPEKVAGNVVKDESLENIASMRESPPQEASEKQTEQFREFKRLRKIATVIKDKRKKYQEGLLKAKRFFEQEAELGSDNEDHDDEVKRINKREDDEEYDGDDLDEELAELIDNAVDINESDEDEAFRKYQSDIKEKDREELQKIMRGEFRRGNGLEDEIEMEEDERNRLERMEKMVEWIKNREDDDQGLYADVEDEEEQNFYSRDRKKKRPKALQETQGNHVEDFVDPEVMAKKLEAYLEDSISPIKKRESLQTKSDFFQSFRNLDRNPSFKTANSLIKWSAKGITNSGRKGDADETIKAKSDSVLNLAGKKSGESKSAVGKLKKTTSHMSEILNKAISSQKGTQNSYLAGPSKLNTLWTRGGKFVKK